MKPYVLPITDFKKDYEFLWIITSDSGILSFLLDTAAFLYVSQLTEKIDLPDDEIETEDITIGNLVYPVPKKVTMNPITVTYLDDGLNTVYQFHKRWMNRIRNNGMCLNPMASYCSSGTYITLDKTLTSAEYIALFSKLKESAVTETLLEAYAKPTSMTIFPNLFPVKISRGTVNKSGTELARVTVTYKRLPNFTPRHKSSWCEYNKTLTNTFKSNLTIIENQESAGTIITSD